MVNPILDLRSDSYEADAPETVLALLDGVCDPEIPTLTIAELGVLRNARIDDDVVTVVITPTYIGCPAMHEIELNIKKTLAKCDYDKLDFIGIKLLAQPSNSNIEKRISINRDTMTLIDHAINEIKN